jgi:catechol 2,3-dioxygenase-like lactoylglutathione lyase family enzyme
MTNLTVSHVCVWVEDQDAARDFYVDKLGFELRQDSDIAGFRWVTVSPPGQPELEIALNVPGPPATDPATTEQLRAIVAKGVSGGLILAVEDCRAAYDELRARGVEFTEEPSERPYGIDAAFRDPSGNSFRLVQPVSLPSPATA